jgi:hypothetical protein
MRANECAKLVAIREKGFWPALCVTQRCVQTSKGMFVCGFMRSDINHKPKPKDLLQPVAVPANPCSRKATMFDHRRVTVMDCNVTPKIGI